jgi:hypothetical protein
MKVVPQKDAIRIIPLKSGKIKHPPPQGLAYRGGPLIPNVAIHAIYWGTYWTTARNPSTNDIDAFLQFISSSSFITQLAEYNAGGFNIGQGRFVDSRIQNTPLSASISDAEIEQQLNGSIASPGPGVNNDLYFCFFPPGTQVTMGGGASCTSFCGYHNATSSRIYYAVIPYPGCNGCKPEADTLSSLTIFSSHELAEAITDPIPGSGWYDDVAGEIGDSCNQQPKPLGNYFVQKIWSAQANHCV